MLLGLAALLKAAAWPLVACVALYFFRDAITDFMKRIQKWEASSTGLKTEMQPPQQIETLKDALDLDEAQASIKFAPLDPAFDNEYKKITDFIERGGATAPLERLEAAKRMYAVAATEKQFELIHRLIFNSQLQAVITANAVGGRLPKTELLNFYSAASSQHPSVYANIPFEQWLKYLIDTNLLAPSEFVANLLNYDITPFARAYLKYAVGAQLPPRSL